MEQHRGDPDVLAAFLGALAERGWSVTTEPGHLAGPEGDGQPRRPGTRPGESPSELFGESPACSRRGPSGVWHGGLVARRGVEVLVVEVAGVLGRGGSVSDEERASGVTWSVDAGYGRLMRRVGGHGGADVRCALVVPDRAAGVARRVPAAVRAGLSLDVWQVSPTGAVSTDSPWFTSLAVATPGDR